MELSKIVQESVEKFEENRPREVGKEKRYGYKNIEVNTIHTVTDWEFLKKDLISSQISLLEAELERKKGMMKNITRDNYDGDDLNSAREYYGIWAITWDEIIRYEDGQSKVLEEDITYLTEQIAEIKKTNL